MMWNWLISSLAVGATIFLYEGNPLYPDPMRMFELIEKHKITAYFYKERGNATHYIDFSFNIPEARSVSHEYVA